VASISDIGIPGSAEPTAGLQESDINDGAILSATYVEPAGNDSVVYGINLPSGRIYKMGPVPEHMRREANRAWLTNVRSQIILDATPQRDLHEPGYDEVEEAKIRLQRELEMQGEGLVLEGHRDPVQTSGYTKTETVTDGFVRDPVKFAKEQLGRLLVDIAQNEEKIAMLQANKKAAEAALKIWSKLAMTAPAKRRRKRRSAAAVAPSRAASTSDECV
jgi:hypothetical protein